MITGAESVVNRERMRARQREQRLNRTWRNPRYYVLLLVLPVAFALALPQLLARAIAVPAEWIADYLDGTLFSMWAPLRNWVTKGEKA